MGGVQAVGGGDAGGQQEGSGMGSRGAAALPTAHHGAANSTGICSGRPARSACYYGTTLPQPLCSHHGGFLHIVFCNIRNIFLAMGTGSMPDGLFNSWWSCGSSRWRCMQAH